MARVRSNKFLIINLLGFYVGKKHSKKHTLINAVCIHTVSLFKTETIFAY